MKVSVLKTGERFASRAPGVEAGNFVIAGVQQVQGVQVRLRATESLDLVRIREQRGLGTH